MAALGLTVEQYITGKGGRAVLSWDTPGLSYDTRGTSACVFSAKIFFPPPFLSWGRVACDIRGI